QTPVINVDLWRGAARPPTAMPGRAGARGVGSLALLFVLLAAAAAGAAVYILVRSWTGIRPQTGSGPSAADRRPPRPPTIGTRGTAGDASQSAEEGSRPAADVEKANARR